MRLRSWMCWGAACIGFAASSGCADDDGAAGTDGAGGGGSGGAGGAGGAGSALAWSPCPLSTGGEGNEAECAEVEVPLDWDRPDGEKIEVFVKRIVGTGSQRQQVWLLTGGPGDASAGLEGLLAQPLAALSPSSDIYLVDHRGVGRSTRLGCPDQEVPGVDWIEQDEWPACFAHLDATWGEGIGSFNTTNAARDVGALIEETRAPGQEVHVYGISYGTYWAQRYLQIFPDQPTSVTLDGLCQAGICSLTTFAHWVDQVGRKFMDACGANAFCAGKLAGDPLAAMGAFLDGLDQGACPGLAGLGINRLLASQLFGAFVATLETRALVPALVYRGNRCSDADVAVFQHLAEVLSAPPDPSSLPPDAHLSSQVLSLHIAISEMLELHPRPLSEGIAEQEQAYFWSGDVASEYALFEMWPRYPHDAYVGGYPDTAAPMLLMNGTLDPQTPIEFADQIAPNYTQPHQTFVAVPDAPHMVVVRSPTVAPPHTPCGLSMFAGFIEDPLAPIDTSCLSDIVPLDFHGDAAMAEALFGTSDPWEGASMAMKQERAIPSAQVSRALDEVRRAFQRARHGALSVR